MSVAMPLDPEENESCLYICFDIETEQTRAVENKEDTFVHEALLLCAEQWCEACDEEEDTTKHCPECGVKEFVANGPTCVADFMEYVTLDRTEFNEIIIFAHNLKVFDICLS
jgi:hypothetical protein